MMMQRRTETGGGKGQDASVIGQGGWMRVLRGVRKTVSWDVDDRKVRLRRDGSRGE